jgi:hypothetical protein
MKTIYKNLLVIGGMFLSLTLMSVAAVPPDEENPGAKYCRCKPAPRGTPDCLAAHMISFRPICQQGGGDCTVGWSNCR